LIDLARGVRRSRVLRKFEKGLLREIGYEMNLRTEPDSGAPLDPQAQYVYHPERGLRRLGTHERSDMALSGACALAIDADDYRDSATANVARHLMRAVIEHHLNGRPLATRQIFFALQQP
jgi:DNA repair protein RecO (recombination protein O)